MIVDVLDRLGVLLRDRETTAGRATNFALYVLNTAFILLYIVSTYPLAPPYPSVVRALEVLLAVVFLGEFGIRVYSADDAYGVLTDPYTVVDVLAVLPALVLLPGKGVLVVPVVGAVLIPDVGFLRGLHALRIFRFLRLLVDEQQFLGKTLRVETVRRVELSVTIFLIFFIATGFLYAVESGANPQIATFGDAFYYTVIAVSTVGFGDIVPRTVAGRWVTVTAVLVGFVLIPWQASRLRSLSGAPDETCPTCGEDVAVTDRYCRRCGHAFADASRDDPPEAG